MAPQQLASAAVIRATPYTDGPVSTVPEVISRLEEIQAYAESHEARGQHDGIACFASLYQRISTRIWQAIHTGAFRNPEFVAALDVVFANRFLDALRAGARQPSAVPAAWAPLLARRGNHRITRLQFAAAGVNAHVNFDLAIALADTCSDLRSSPATGAKQESYRQINRIMVGELAALRAQFESTWERLVDHAALARMLSRVDDWTVVIARDVAWESATHLWDLRRRGDSEVAFLRRLDEMAGETGRLVLTPIL